MPVITFSQNQQFSGLDLKQVASTIKWKPVDNLKSLNSDPERLNLYFLHLNAEHALMQQLNIEGWGVCEYRKTDNLNLYNYYYQDITRAIYIKYCKEIAALMMLDGIIKQSR